MKYLFRNITSECITTFSTFVLKHVSTLGLHKSLKVIRDIYQLYMQYREQRHSS